MESYAGLDAGGKTTAICVVDEAGKILWQGVVDAHPDAIAARLKGFQKKLVKIGIESGSFAPHLHRSLTGMGFPMVYMDARRGHHQEPAEMLRTGWFTAVHVKSAESHKIKTLLGALTVTLDCRTST
jgi:transposase